MDDIPGLCDQDISKETDQATMEDGRQECLPGVRDEKSSDSDANSEDLSSNDEQININSNSQFYESSDSKLDYAVKIDDNDTLSDIDDIKTDTASADSEDSALGSLPPDSGPNDDDDAQDRSDGSDCGLGPDTSDNSEQPNFALALPCSSGLNSSHHNSSNAENSDDNESCGQKSSGFNHNFAEENSFKSNIKRKFEQTGNDDGPKTKRAKQGIHFDSVTVFYFPRAQGFSCVPSQGGSTLGMEWEHTHMQKFTLTEHALEQRRLHRQILQQIKNERHNMQGVTVSSSEDSDTEEETSDISESELDLDSYYFLQPVPTRQRRALLRAAGVRKIEGFEKDECRDIRTSREFCGCACKGTCNPETCSCSLAGIKCQVDRLNFPCGCTRDGCCNTTGRIEFNPLRVRTHFINTLMRIGLEKKNEENQEAAKRQWAEAYNVSSSACLNTTFERERCLSQEDGLVRDVNLTPRVEVESCVNSGSFNNVHCDINTSNKVDATYSYRNNVGGHLCINDNAVGHFEDKGNDHHHTPYSSNMLLGKGPPYSTSNTLAFNAMSNMQNFPCDLNYVYEQHAESHNFKNLTSFSASSFEEFAHSSQISMYNHYGHLYMPDYMHKPGPSMSGHSSMPYHVMAQNHFDPYKNNSECVNMENKNGSHYTTLMTYQNSNRLQPVQNDENWFSHNTLMSLDNCEHITQDSVNAQATPTEATADTDSTEPTENFGELIKKTMVESVTA
ncbi:PREDICTED: uncharacterized protein LOC106118320 [Papilio xuthus]|uniref:Uncharacterized protein LOC106118320 n=1 Tax=Papilio xuthus TaxID=66420 RepID=A0AAJ6ZAJ9_PAPXU|nr:PREDICTED: uncharacterized protein LOC106118320 [Papilio xuthus]